MNPWLSMGIVALAFAGLAVLLDTLRKRRHAHPEWIRKGLHIGMGLVVLGFPWLFKEFWPVALLTGGFVLVLLMMRWLPAWRAGIGNVVSGVERASWGDICFPVAIAVLFLVGADRPVFYVISVLVLALADAGAALGGLLFGRHPYTADEGFKSWEGTTAFTMLAFLSCWLPLGLSNETPWRQAALVAGAVSLLAAMIEAGAWRGLDNLLVPLSVMALLKTYAGAPWAELWLVLIVLGVLGVAFLALRRLVLLREGSFLAALVLVFLCWTIGGWPWTIAPMTLLALHSWFRSPELKENELLKHAHPALLSTAVPALGWLFASRFSGYSFFAPFNVTIAAQLAMSIVTLWQAHPGPRSSWQSAAAALFAWIAVFGPFWWMVRDGDDASRAAGFGLPLVWAASFAHERCLLFARPERSMSRYWRIRAGLAILVSMLMAFLL